MARYAKTDVRIWGDEKVREMTPIPPCGQGLWIRLLVSKFRSCVPGLICAGEAALAEDLGWSLEDFRKAYAEVSSKGLAKADWKARVVWLPNAIAYNIPESPNVVKSWRIPWDETPDCPLKLEAFYRLKAFLEGYKKAFAEAFAKTCEQPSGKPWANQEQEQEQEQEGFSPRAIHGAGACDPDEPAEPIKPSGFDWLTYYNARFFQRRGKQRGAASDAKATSDLHDKLKAVSVGERMEDWARREVIVDEFLARSDRKTVEAGHMFAFFVNAFDALRVPKENRPAEPDRRLPVPTQDPSRGHMRAQQTEPAQAGRLEMP